MEVSRRYTESNLSYFSRLKSSSSTKRSLPCCRYANTVSSFLTFSVSGRVDGKEEKNSRARPLALGEKFVAFVLLRGDSTSNNGPRLSTVPKISTCPLHRKTALPAPLQLSGLRNHSHSR